MAFEFADLALIDMSLDIVAKVRKEKDFPLAVP